jgi:chromosome segregation ATPase
MAMAENLRDMIVETNRDVKWICRTLKRMEERDDEMEGRLRALEGWRSETAGEERREREIAAGAGGVVGGIVAVVVKVIGWG